MSNYTTNLKTWGDQGVEYPDAYNQQDDVPPVAEWHDFLFYNQIEDIQHLIDLTNDRLETDIGTSYVTSPEDGHIMYRQDKETLEVYETATSSWESLTFEDDFLNHTNDNTNPHTVDLNQVASETTWLDNGFIVSDDVFIDWGSGTDIRQSFDSAEQKLTFAGTSNDIFEISGHSGVEVSNSEFNVSNNNPSVSADTTAPVKVRSDGNVAMTLQADESGGAANLNWFDYDNDAYVATATGDGELTDPTFSVYVADSNLDQNPSQEKGMDIHGGSSLGYTEFPNTNNFEIRARSGANDGTMIGIQGDTDSGGANTETNEIRFYTPSGENEWGLRETQDDNEVVWYNHRTSNTAIRYLDDGSVELPSGSLDLSTGDISGVGTITPSSGTLTLGGGLDLDGNNVSGVQYFDFGGGVTEGSFAMPDTSGAKLSIYDPFNSSTTMYFYEGGRIDAVDGPLQEQGNRVATRTWTNNNADVPNADYADSAGNANTVDGYDIQKNGTDSAGVINFKT